jgi:hypothetical protein
LIVHVGVSFAGGQAGSLPRGMRRGKGSGPE